MSKKQILTVRDRGHQKKRPDNRPKVRVTTASISREEQPLRGSAKKIWAWLGASILLATSALWAYWGAQIQLGNADQLINTYLFETPATLHGASLPAQHTFLLKAPLLWLVNALGPSNLAFTLVTMFITLLTVGGLAYIIYRIIRRPIPFGILCLVLSCTLLLVPAQPYPGATLPVNMAMLTTRNIEYVLFMISLILIAKLPRIAIKSWRFWLAVVCTALLVASDKLFLVLGIGGALLTLALYGLLRVRQLVVYAVNWLLISLIGGVAATGALLLLGNVVHIVGGDAGPYSLVTNLHDLALGSVYAVLHIFTNAGANPAFDTTTLKDMPGQAVTHLTGIGGLALLTNLIAAGTAMIISAKLIWKSRKQPTAPYDWPHLLLFGLVSTSAVAIIAFVATKHYYPVDARYVAISFFALPVALAVWLKDAQWSAKKTRVIGAVLGISILSAIGAAAQTYTTENTANAPLAARNTLVASAMRQHQAKVLLGDYWHVIPIRQTSQKGLNVIPLDSCTHPRGILTSSAWQTDYMRHGFAYLLSLGAHSPDFPNCTLDQVVDAYGKPNKSVVIAGTRDLPKELLLFYDDGARPRTRTAVTKPPATVVPINLDQLTPIQCPTGKTIVTTVAHQDDDLLFMNPDRLHSIQQGDCIRTIYMTAGDAGSDQLYWIGREKGSEAAYDTMIGAQKHSWIDRIVRLPTGQFVVIANPISNPRISLIFMRLPDGNTNGTGFKATHNQSLARLKANKISAINTVNGQSHYTAHDISTTLETLLDFYNPDEVDTQTPLNLSKKYPDHSDHLTVGQFTQEAYQPFHAAHPETTIKYYTGYPIHDSPVNVTDDDHNIKGNIFFNYAQYDADTCITFMACDSHTVYGEYLKRQYQYIP